MTSAGLAWTTASLLTTSLRPGFGTRVHGLAGPGCVLAAVLDESVDPVQAARLGLHPVDAVEPVSTVEVSVDLSSDADVRTRSACASCRRSLTRTVWVSRHSKRPSRRFDRGGTCGVGGVLFWPRRVGVGGVCCAARSGSPMPRISPL